MKSSLFLKAFAGFLLIIAFVSVFFLFISFNMTKNFYLETLSRHLEDVGRTLKHKIIPYLEGKDFKGLDSFVKKFATDIQTRITVVDSGGKVLADSEKEPETMENHRYRPEILNALEGGVGRSIRYSYTVKEKMLYVGIPIEGRERISYVLRLSLYVKQIDRLFSALKTSLLRISLLLIAIALVSALIFSRSLTSPLKELKTASDKVASGDFLVHVDTKRKDEFRDLVRAFNFMIEKIKDLIEKITCQKEELNGILSSIEEGIMALDGQGRVLYSNESMAKIVKNCNLEGKFYWEVIRKPQFLEWAERVLREKKNDSREIEIDGKTMLCKLIFVHEKEEAVITFHDISKEKEVEKMKKDFISNVSHELKTPLTAIKGFAETLEGRLEDENRRYLEIIRRHTERLINIVNDLLFLHEVEEAHLMEIEDINLIELLKELLEIFEGKLREKNLELEFKAEPELPFLRGDRFKLEQLFLNLIDNAIKYTEKGKITVEVKKSDPYLSVMIEDTGIGIAEEHLSRIFERFYVVSKSRARSAGGTGLGLSIVKHIALLHGGKVNVESVEGKGSRFTVLLPY